MVTGAAEAAAGLPEAGAAELATVDAAGLTAVLAGALGAVAVPPQADSSVARQAAGAIRVEIDVSFRGLPP